MQIRQSWLVFGLILAPVAFGSQEIQETLEASAEVRAENKAFNRGEAESLRLASYRHSESQTALNRIKAACVPVVDQETKQETRMVEGEPITLAQNLPDRTLGNGTLICNSLGDTGEVWDGKISFLASAAPTDMEEYTKYFGMQR